MFAVEGLAEITISHLPKETEDTKALADDIAMYGCEVNLVALDPQGSHMAKFGHLNVQPLEASLSTNNKSASILMY